MRAIPDKKHVQYVIDEKLIHKKMARNSCLNNVSLMIIHESVCRSAAKSLLLALGALARPGVNF